MFWCLVFAPMQLSQRLPFPILRRSLSEPLIDLRLIDHSTRLRSLLSALQVCATFAYVLVKLFRR